MRTTTPTASVRREQDLIVVPDAVRTRRWGRVAAIVAAALAVIIFTGMIGYRIGLDQGEEELAQVTTASRVQVDQANAELATTQQELTASQQQVASLTAQTQELQQQNEVLRASKNESTALLDQTEAELDATQAQLQAATGPAVSDGAHITRVVAVGSTQAPQRIVVQVDRWFTGRAARRAAIADGVIGPNGRLPHPRYLRRGAGVWRTLNVSPSAPVLIRDGRPGVGLRTVTIAGLEQILRMDAAWARRVAHDPFWITVSGGTVTKIEQQLYP